MKEYLIFVVGRSQPHFKKAASPRDAISMLRRDGIDTKIVKVIPKPKKILASKR